MAFATWAPLVTQVAPDCQQNSNLFFGTCFSSFRRNLRGQLCHDCRAVKQLKAQMIKARVSANMKRGIDHLADKRGESEAVIVREALSQYLTKSTILLESKPSYRPKSQTNSARGLSLTTRFSILTSKLIEVMLLSAHQSREVSSRTGQIASHQVSKRFDPPSTTAHAVDFRFIQVRGDVSRRCAAPKPILRSRRQ